MFTPKEEVLRTAWMKFGNGAYPFSIRIENDTIIVYFDYRADTDIHHRHVNKRSSYKLNDNGTYVRMDSDSSSGVGGNKGLVGAEMNFRFGSDGIRRQDTATMHDVVEEFLRDNGYQVDGGFHFVKLDRDDPSAKLFTIVGLMMSIVGLILTALFSFEPMMRLGYLATLPILAIGIWVLLMGLRVIGSPQADAQHWFKFIIKAFVIAWILVLVIAVPLIIWLVVHSW
ncbi:MAG: hypothetical protein UHN88_02320 [Eubacterium sp.]|nr:hypothetical protein [Eubacterium sp.]